MECPHCGLDYDPEPIGYPLIRWNKIAARCGLHGIQKMTPTRIRYLACRVAEHPAFWTLLEESIAKRGAWARGRKFPTFDQAVSLSIFQKLLEGNYDAKPGEVQDDERTILILALRGHRIGDTVASKDGLEGSRGVEPWEAITIERLRRMSDVSRTGV